MFRVPIEVVKVAQDQSTGSEMALIKAGTGVMERDDKRIYTTKYYIVYSTGEATKPLLKEEAEKYFTGHIKRGDLI